MSMLSIGVVLLSWWAIGRAPAWASGGLGGASAAPITGSFAERLLAYRGICGPLSVDLMLAGTFLLCFAICAGTETAITTLWPWKVRELAQREREQYELKERQNAERYKIGQTSTIRRRGTIGKWNALREDIQRFMQTILIGATLSGVVSTAFITEICAQLFGPKGLAIAAGLMSFVQLTVCEILPKSIAVSNPQGFAKVVLPTFYWLSGLIYPFSKFLNVGVKLVLSLFGVSVDTSKTPFVSEEELDIMISSAMKSGIVDAEEGMMIRSVRNLDSKSVKEVMTPLVDMIGIEANESISILHQLCLAKQFSRMPVFQDRFDNIIGVVSMKTLLKHAGNWEGQGGPPRFEDLAVHEISDKPFFIPETMSLLNALRSLKDRTLAICVDEYGGTTGLVTLEDVLEEIVGEIYDPEEEKDALERMKNTSKIACVGPGRFSMSAQADIDDVNEVLDIELPSGDYNSIGGFFCSVIDRIPLVGEAITAQPHRESVRFEVIEADDRKIIKVEAYSERLEAAELERLALEAREDDEDVGGRGGFGFGRSRRESDADEDDGDRPQVLECRPESEDEDSGSDDDGRRKQLDQDVEEEKDKEEEKEEEQKDIEEVVAPIAPEPA
eukprot:CAMPEP_0115334282 /NCGR_PEP_ID=MMETSP0270-20121206/87823_1 /TAXON_ID=71861 /ORGANISM="Scrippsiella trochoidea, Strain CCMP3099" /LENGTH=612 /DNA_ID=CAMNT_0002755245 /DNA_START=69 /DNA_END=1904 /DNA_ORIENTATION=-